MPSKVVSQSEWLEARKALLEKEKELTRASDALAAERRELPMVKVEKEYTFKGPDDKELSLADLFGDKDQLIVYHFMFGPDDDCGCSGCSFIGEHIPDLRHIRSKNTAMVVVSRASFAKLDAWKRKVGWTFPWYSSEGSDFNYDFHVTLDESVCPVQYNFASKTELEAKGRQLSTSGEMPGISVFYRENGVVYHTYSAYARGCEKVIGTLMLLDLTPLGRQDSPAGPGEYKIRYKTDDDV